MLSRIAISVLFLGVAATFGCRGAVTASSELSGLVSAVFTPYADDGSVDLDLVDLQAKAVRNVSAVFVAGTTGESLSLTLAERKTLAEEWMRVKPVGVEIIVHVGTCTVSDSIELAEHAQKIGASAIGAMPPFFFKPPGVNELVATMKVICQAAPQLPCYFYHIPEMTGVDFPVYEFLEEAIVKMKIPNMAGAKFSSYDLKDFGTCVADGFDVFIGKDECVMSAHVIGASGAVGSTFNFASPLIADILLAMDRGDFEGAQKLQFFMDKLINLFRGKYGDAATSAQKAMMKMLGADIGVDVRLPQRSLTAARYAELQDDLENIGFFDYIPPFKF